MRKITTGLFNHLLELLRLSLLVRQQKDLLYPHNKSQLVPVMEGTYVEWQITVKIT